MMIIIFWEMTPCDSYILFLVEEFKVFWKAWGKNLLIKRN
jgi:hypothetical protein